MAVDATGLAQGAVSTFFVRRLHHRGQKPLPWRHWLKWVVAADLDRQFLFSQSARRGPWNDCGRNRTYIWQQPGAQSVIPSKHENKTWRIQRTRPTCDGVR